jgi:hypothetical protein
VKPSLILLKQAPCFKSSLFFDRRRPAAIITPHRAGAEADGAHPRPLVGLGIYLVNRAPRGAAEQL